MQATTPCPFCHSAPQDVMQYETFPVYYTVLCLACAARGPSAATPEAAQAGWKKRKREKTPLPRLCPGCGTQFEAKRPNQRYCDRRCKNRVVFANYRQRQQALARAQAWDEVVS